MAGVVCPVADQCMYGLTTKAKDRRGGMPAKTSTKFMTNSWHVAQELMVRCNGKHEHQVLLGGDRARRAQEYPQELCRSICPGLINEKRMRKGDTVPLLRLSKVADGVMKRLQAQIKEEEEEKEETRVADGGAFTFEVKGLSNVIRATKAGRVALCLLQKVDQAWVGL